MLTVTLDEDIERYLERLGADSEATKAELVRSQLKALLEEEIEDRYWAELAATRLAHQGAAVRQKR